MSSFRVVYLIKHKKHKSAKPLIPQGFWHFLISITNFIKIIIFIDFHTFYIVREQNVSKYVNIYSTKSHLCIHIFRNILRLSNNNRKMYLQPYHINNRY